MNHLIIEALNECLREQNTELKAELAALKAKIEALPGLLVELEIPGQEIDCIKEHFGEGK